MIGILNAGFGNLHSLASAIERLGYDFLEITNVTEKWNELTHLIIPGVGDFATASESLLSSGVYKKIKDFVDQEKPLLGICLGMQLMALQGHERGVSQGLGFVNSITILMEADEDHPLPHVGWNNVSFIKPHPVFSGIKDNMDFYFTHSYVVKDVEAEFVYGKTTYSKDFPSVIAFKNIVGTQFHPEKSLKNGLKLLDNFCRWNGQC